MRAGAAFFANDSSLPGVSSWDDLKGKTVAVQKGARCRARRRAKGGEGRGPPAGWAWAAAGTGHSRAGLAGRCPAAASLAAPVPPPYRNAGSYYMDGLVPRYGISALETESPEGEPPGLGADPVAWLAAESQP